MLKFRTEYHPEKSSFFVDPSKPVVLVGSCFTQNIAAKMQAHGWNATNPAGTLYNPFSIALAIDMMLDEEKGPERFENSLFQFNGLWNSRDFDSSFSSSHKEDSIQDFIQRSRLFQEKISEGKFLIVTFGTSICYHELKNMLVVGNCHKQPANLFYTQRKSPMEIADLWNKFLQQWRMKVPGLKIIFTVSPVRHIKDGFTGNSRSKAALLLGVELICMNNQETLYFPAYEIINDDLRDYRFYASDLLHPSEEAIEYIWEKFVETYITPAGKRILEEGAARIKSASHRPKTGALGKPLKMP